MTGNANQELIRNWYANYLSEDTIAEDSEWHIAEGYPGGGVYHGRRAYFDDYFAGLRSHFDTWEAVPEQLVDADGGRAVIGIGHYHGKVKGSGEEADIPFLHVWWIEDGRIAFVRAAADTAVFTRILWDDPAYQAQVRRSADVRAADAPREPAR